MISDEIKNQLVAQDRGTGDAGEVGSCENARSICIWAEKTTDAAEYGTSKVIDIEYISSDVNDPSISTEQAGESLFILGEYTLATFEQISYSFRDIDTNESITKSGWPPTDPRIKYMYKLIEDPRTLRDVIQVVDFVIEFDFSSIGSPPTSDIATSDPITYNVYVDTANEKAYRKDRISFIHTVRNYSFRKLTSELAAVLSDTPITTPSRPEWARPFNSSGLAKGEDKLLGNINTATLNTIQTTEPWPETFPNYWNSAINGNVCKWRPVETNQGEFDFSGADILHKFCKDNNLKMIWHTLLWGANQGYPTWFVGLSEEDSKAAVQAWFKAIADRYGDDIYGIQVLNELTPGHQDTGTTILRNQLGGAGETGYDWIIWVYQQARHYFPNAILWTNDFGMMNNTSNSASNRSYMYGVINALKEAGENDPVPLVDAFGMQSHYFNVNDLTSAEVTSVLNEVYDQTRLPIHITELDISGSEEQQLERYQKIFPSMWEHPAVDRVNLWGWITGETWRHDQGHVTGLIDRDGSNKRPAFIWLENYFEDRLRTTSETLARQLLVKDNLIINIDAENSDSNSGSGTDIIDLQGNANATLSGTFNDTIPKNWEIDKDAGSSVEFITFGDIETFNAPQDFTFSLWFEFTSISGDHDIFTKGSHSTNKPILCWYDATVGSGTDAGNTQTISFMVTDNSNQHWIAAPNGSIVANQIYNLVVQHNTSGRSRIWINGAEQRDHTQSSTDGMKNDNNPLKIGAPTNATQDSDMKIYAFHAYDSFLTDDQINQNWNALRHRFGI